MVEIIQLPFNKLYDFGKFRDCAGIKDNKNLYFFAIDYYYYYAKDVGGNYVILANYEGVSLTLGRCFGFVSPT